MTETVTTAAAACASFNQINVHDAWKLEEGKCYVCVAKQLGSHHWCLLRTIRVKSVNLAQQYIDAVTLGYHQADGDYWVKIEELRMPFDRLKTLAAGASVYRVDEVQLTVLSQSLLELTVTKSSLRKFEDAVEACAEHKVS